MKIFKQIPVEVLDKVQCDMCDVVIEGIGENMAPEFAELKANWGYGSKRDGEQAEYHICEQCFEKLELFIKQERRIESLFDDEQDEADKDL